jgi:hypothetical protein
MGAPLMTQHLSYHEALPPPVDLGFSPAPAPRRAGRLTLSPDRRAADSPERKAEKEQEERGEEEAEGREEGHERRWARSAQERLMKQANRPPTFSRDSSKDKTPEVRDWIHEMDAYLRFQLAGATAIDPHFTLHFALTCLTGAAGDFITNKAQVSGELAKTGSLQKPMTWEDARQLLVAEFEAPHYRALKRMELQALRLGKGAHKTLPLFNAAFDKLARSLYPLGTDLTAATNEQSLMDEYSRLIELSNNEMWYAINMSLPSSLAEWKAKTAAAWSATELKLQKERERGMQDRMQGGYSMKRSVYSGQTAGTVKANRMQASETEEGEETRERQEGEGEEKSALQRMQATPTKKKGGQQKGESNGYQLSDTEREQLMAKGACFRCYKTGHLSRGCPDKGKPRKAPRLEDLKA